MNGAICLVLAMLVAVVVGQGGQTQYTYFNNNPQCGLRHHYNGPRDIPDSRVVGGNATTVGDHMWMVVLLYNGALRCGGSIISSRVVLNAAHCTVNTVPTAMAFLRTNTRNAQESWSQQRQAQAIYNHPSYSSATYSNDISIIILAAGFNFTDYQFVGPICLGSFTPAGMQRAIATGWGSTSSGGAVVQGLREAYMPIAPDANTIAQYGSAYIPATMIGAALVGDGLDTCQGDSGGPLSVSCGGATSNSATQLCECGIVSWGYGCGNIGIYSRVQTYLPWIESTTTNSGLLPRDNFL